MAKNYAYTRISDQHKQGSQGQRACIQEYADDKGLYINKWFEYKLSGSKTSKEERGLVAIIEILKPGDRILVTDIERLGRDSISDILEVTTRIINAGAELHFCLSAYTLTPEHKNDVAQFFITIGKAFAAQDFSHEKSLKALAAAARRKRQGLPTGRPPGAIIRSKLDVHEQTILFWLSQEVLKTEIARRLKASPTTLHNWLNRRDDLICMARDAHIYEPGMKLSDIKTALKKYQANK
ncbi:recombinase family protein [Pseudoalteromonas rubra]|uniref:recombinase family protein n=1 Tax=Pseudoalteromonas rubra TaxID=43658 RepID=UPI002DB95087|nr:recombinase family protein [Pseudoalteromonas rubra]MEC4091628.1 recombinase family protein [Pseudoalteromonas rubra]